MTRGGSRVALATYESRPDLASDDRALVPALAARGIEALPVVWSAQSADWDSFDAVVVRSCWDYHLRLSEFNGWLDRLVQTGVPVWNSPGLLRWNADKRYLLDLASRGARTVPTILIGGGPAADIGDEAAARGWTKFVIKPAVSASGYETHLMTLPLDGAARRVIDRVGSRGDLLVQPFVEEIALHGELSFTFLDGSYSHATLKRAAAGEFRVQSDHGGSADAVAPSTGLVREAAEFLALLPEVPLYARVDAVVRHGGLLLMELELIEPNLFLRFGAGATDRMADAVAARLHR